MGVFVSLNVLRLYSFVFLIFITNNSAWCAVYHESRSFAVLLCSFSSFIAPKGNRVIWTDGEQRPPVCVSTRAFTFPRSFPSNSFPSSSFFYTYLLYFSLRSHLPPSAPSFSLFSRRSPARSFLLFFLILFSYSSLACYVLHSFVALDPLTRL